MRVFIVTRDKINIAILIIVVIVGVFFEVGHSNAVYTMVGVDKKVVVIDAGHGGWDPGKTGTNGLDEKDINLSVAQKLQGYLEQSGATVIISRDSDEALDTSKKGDMLKRKNIVDESHADVMVSIHQNAFPSDNVNGAQVFYYSQSENGKILAETIQKSLVENLDSSNTRQAKSNSNYYILKKTEVPAAIVECGFLSNSKEENLLNDDAYQEKVAWAVYLGIMEYFNEIGQ